MKLDYLGGTNILIDQGKEFYRMNSDTELLGRFYTYQTPTSIP